MAEQITATLKVEGLKELEAALQELPKATGKNVIRKALLAAAEPMVAMASQLVPVKTGRLKSSIAVSKIKFTGGTAGKAAFAAAMAEGATRAEAANAARAANVAAGGDDPGITSAVLVMGPGRMPQAHLQEFGTVHHGPQPYMRPAWDAHKDNAIEIIKTEMWDQIQKSAARLARKAAKFAASK